MTVKRIDTLGCHPLVLLKKLASVGGVEILKEEKHVYEGKEYPYRIVAKVRDGLYLEAYDGLYEQATTAARLPRMAATAFSNAVGTITPPSDPFPLEATEAHKGAACPAVHYDFADIYRFGIFRDSDLQISQFSPSVLYSTIVPREKYAVLLLDAKAFGFSSAGALAMTVAQPPSGCSFTAGGSSGTPFYTGRNTDGGVSPTGPWVGGFPFAVTGSGVRIDATLPCSGGACVFLGAVYAGSTYDGATSSPRPLVVSGAVIRVSKDADSNGVLLNPGEWRGLPIFAQIVANDFGLLFLNPGGPVFGGTLFVTNIEGAAGTPGKFPGVYRNCPTQWYVGTPEAEGLRVVGTSTNPGAAVAVNLFSAVPPIANDEGTGGPVASEILAYTATEIRGAIDGVLSVPENLPIGTAGWLDGKKYSVLAKGRMFQVG